MAVFIAVSEFALSHSPGSLVLDYFAVPNCGNPFQYVTAGQSVSGNHASNEMLAVAAVNAGSPTEAASYSSRGPHDIFFPAFESRPVPHISATDCVQTRTGQLGHFSNPFCGTSAAAPHVAGIAALLLDAAPSLNSQQARSILMGTAVDLGSVGFDLTYGAGRIDALAAVGNVSPSLKFPPNDYDGDGRSDITVFRPTTGFWFMMNSATGSVGAQQWGGADDIPVSGDYNGDDKADIAVFRPATGVWFINQSSNGGVRVVQWGAPGDVPVPGDYDGDGNADIAVFRPATGVWFINQSSNGGVRVVQWGAPGDVPVPGDYDGDGNADIAVFRPATGVWFIKQSATAVFGSCMGRRSDMPVRATTTATAKPTSRCSGRRRGCGSS